MVIILQYTVTDIRKFDNSFTLLKLPQWPLPEPYKEFVRGNGQIIPRADNTISAHLGKTSISESFVCKIKKGIKTSKKICVAEVGNLYLRNKINHYFSDGGVLSKYEFVYETEQRDWNYNYKQLKVIINQILETNISIRNKEFKYTNYKFKNLLPGLKELQIISTTEKKYLNDSQAKYIIKCTPQVFVTLNNKESFSYRSRNKLNIPVRDSFNSTLFGWWEKYNNNPYKFWVLRNCATPKNENIITLRTGILRIHSEKECINNVIQSLLLGLLSSPPNTEGSDFLQSFLNNKIKDIALDYKKISMLDGSSNKIEDFIKEAYDNFNPGEITLLGERMKQLKLRPQIEEKIVKHILHNATYIEKQIIMDNSQKITFGNNSQFTGDIHQINKSGNNPSFDFKSVYNSITELLEKISKEHNSYEKDVAVENLEAAKKAAIKQDHKGLVDSLKKAGSWAIDFASKIGVNFITEIIKHKIN
jgi:hypothetical protein